MRSEERETRSEGPATGSKRLHKNIVASTARFTVRSISQSSLLAPRSVHILVVLLSLTNIGPIIAQPFTLDDIEFWVGTGSNRAAVVIDWVEDSAEPRALAWGYRWNGAATGRDMLTAIVAADTRLFAKFGGTPGDPVAVYGLGYDADDDGEFGTDDGTQFDAAGAAYSGPADLAMATDAGDYYAEGWFTAFWYYGVEAPAGANPYDGGSWSDIAFGMANRVLADGAWDSWAFTPTFDFGAFAESPAAALPPFSPGDFNFDGHVDGADYSVWRSAFGSTSTAADANGDGIVDAADYVIWRKHADASAAAAVNAVSTPEPGTVWLSLLPLLTPVLFSFRNRKEKLSCAN